MNSKKTMTTTSIKNLLSKTLKSYTPYILTPVDLRAVTQKSENTRIAVLFNIFISIYSYV